MMARRSRSQVPIHQLPTWTEAEDQTFTDMLECGLCPMHWQRFLPGREFREVLERRDYLLKVKGVRRAPLI
jgi:hypothetical protein